MGRPPVAPQRHPRRSRTISSLAPGENASPSRQRGASHPRWEGMRPCRARGPQPGEKRAGCRCGLLDLRPCLRRVRSLLLPRADHDVPADPSGEGALHRAGDTSEEQSESPRMCEPEMVDGHVRAREEMEQTASGAPRVHLDEGNRVLLRPVLDTGQRLPIPIAPESTAQDAQIEDARPPENRTVAMIERDDRFPTGAQDTMRLVDGDARSRCVVQDAKRIDGVHGAGPECQTPRVTPYEAHRKPFLTQPCARRE